MEEDVSEAPLSARDKELLQKARSGDAEAQVTLKNLCRTLESQLGGSEEKNLSGYIRAARLGWVPAMLLAGYGLYRGSGAPPNELLALAWFAKGAVLGEKNCLGLVAKEVWKGRLIPRDFALAHTLFRQSHLSPFGDKIGNFMLGLMTENGQGVPTNPSLAAKYYVRSASRGYYLAMIRCSQLHHQGYDVPKFPYHLGWLTHGVTEGCPEELYILGFACLLGQGIAQSDRNALLWLTMTIANDLPLAAAACETLRGRLTVEEVHLVEQRIANLSSDEARETEFKIQLPPEDSRIWNPID